MKKIISLSLITIILITGCGKTEESSETTTEATTSATTEVESNEITTKETTEAKTEAITEETTEKTRNKSLDDIAAYLLDGGYIKGSRADSLYSYIGAINGFKYPDSDTELYEYDTESDTYKSIVENNEVNGLKVSALNGPYILIFSNGNENQEIIDAFKAY